MIAQVITANPMAESAVSGIESAVMLNSETDCSRRTFLGTALAGATSLLFGAAHSVRAETASILSLSAATTSDDITSLDLHEVTALVKGKKISPVEITQACLARIEALNPLLNAFITVTAESALSEARQAESEVQRGEWRGPLHGAPIALKDLFDTAGVRTTAASALFKDRFPQEDAAVVQRLRHAGAVFLGKLNMHEFAFGPTTQRTSYFGRVRNPWATEHISGRFFRRICSGRCSRALLRCSRFRHRRLHPTASSILRDCGPEAHLWSSQHTRSDPGIVVC